MPLPQFAYICDGFGCPKCCGSMRAYDRKTVGCYHTRDREHRKYPEGSGLTQMQKVGRVNGTDYYMERLKRKDDILEGQTDFA